MIIVCGPTGSGKTTLLYTTIIEHLRKRPEIHLLTAEDPIENRIGLPNAEQYEVSEKTTYADFLKSFLRDDPDWIMIGETRDSEVLSTLIDASQTGHLTFTTLHTNDTVSSLDRIVKLYTN
jgi:type IV pilus assembly protein PilB